MFDDPKGPIEHYSWAKFVVLGEEHSEEGHSRKGEGKDIRLVGKKVKKWKERQGHTLDKSMVKRMLEEDVRILVIGNGANGALVVPDEVVDFLLEHGMKKVIVEKTPEACRQYNRLYHEGKKVGLLAHGTC
ncbi:MTH938/NDUFAF3 family protein [Anaerotalea alkaliphila]|uniref:Uncharacterized protein n=1 Tax=Anaerotalea alkaliphila TaxID=2662126 RepID=A0A7X5HXG6_9FIRM|nr:MTH938/NDUFAF3 family protein [Anaerotalea alkaliphila]NDL68408.1 hypothetical protein [Anaerotalea alkaliphila]